MTKKIKTKKEAKVEENNSEEIVFEEENSKSSFGGGSVKKLKEKIKKLEEEKKEYLNGWQRARAEMVNLKKNHQEEKKLFTSLGKEALLKEIIPVLDNFDAAFSNKEAWERVDSAWRTGVEYIYNQFIQILENNGVSQFGSEGDDFDENLYTSIETVETDDEKKDSKIATVIQKGYKMGDKIVREAKVKTYKFKK